MADVAGNCHIPNGELSESSLGLTICTHTLNKSKPLILSCTQSERERERERETRSRSDKLTIATEESQLDILQTNGLHQGSLHSPVLFASLVADRLGGILRTKEKCRQPLPTSGGSYMDDTYLWSLTVEHLQNTVQEVEKALAVDGLKVNGDKTQCICPVAQQGEVTVGGKQVDVAGPDYMIKVLGANFGFLVAGPLLSLPTYSKKPEQFGTQIVTSFVLGGSAEKSLHYFTL